MKAVDAVLDMVDKERTYHAAKTAFDAASAALKKAEEEFKTARITVQKALEKEDLAASGNYGHELRRDSFFTRLIQANNNRRG